MTTTTLEISRQLGCARTMGDYRKVMRSVARLTKPEVLWLVDALIDARLRVDPTAARIARAEASRS